MNGRNCHLLFATKKHPEGGASLINVMIAEEINQFCKAA